MPRSKAKAHHQLSVQLAALSVDTAVGIIRECTVAKSGVPLKGHSVMLDKNGGFTKDEKLCVKKIPIFTDARTLETLMAAAAVASARLKVREDHDDSVGARAGFADAFKLTSDGRVIADLHIFDSYRHRGVVLETAAKTPEAIGLSIDFTPVFELNGDHALMRVEKLHAVDIVDEGAITPGGMFLSAGVDTDGNVEAAKLAEQKTPPTMAEETKKPDAPAADPLAALTQLVAALGAKVDGCMATIGKLAMPAPAAAAAAGDEELKALRLAVETQSTQLKTLAADHVKLKRERALLGLPASSRVALGSASAEDIEAAVAKNKSYLDLVKEARETKKLSASEAHANVRATVEGRSAYEMHLASRGVIKNAA